LQAFSYFLLSFKERTVQDIQTVDYREFIGDTRTEAVPEKRGFPVYRILFAIQAICIGIVFVAAKGWI
jgi:hypothetical protein